MTSQVISQIAEYNDKNKQIALKSLKKIKEREKGKKFKWVPHPTSPRCKIQIEIKE
jgi:hypothetical protein